MPECARVRIGCVMQSSAQTIVSKDNTEEELFAAVLIVLLALLNSAPVPNVSVRMKDLQLQMDYKLFIVPELILRIISKDP